MPQVQLYLLPTTQEGSLPGKGLVPASAAVVGIAPSTKRPESRRLEPFGSTAYKLIRELDQRLDGNLYVTNLIKVPLKPGTKPSISLVREWTPRLMEELKIVEPKRILTFGDAPARVLCPGFTNLREDHGTLFHNRELGCLVVPTYHPAALFRNPKYRDLLARDLQRFMSLADQPVEAADYLLLRGVEGLPPIPKGADVYLDIETTGLEALTDQITMVGLRWDEDGPVYILREPTTDSLRMLGSLLAKAQATLVGHNLQFDLAFIVQASGGKWPRLKVRDTMLQAHVLGEEVLNLKHLTTMYTERPGSRYGGGTDDPLYLAEDVASTQAVDQVLTSRMDQGPHPWALTILYRLVPHIVKSRLDGVYVNREVLASIAQETGEAISDTLADLNEAAGTDSKSTNWNSTQQVVPILRAAGVPLILKTPAGSFSVAEKALLPFADTHAIVSLLLRLRALTKIQEFCHSYTDLADERGYLHPSLRLTGTVTGRPSCRNPNLQQVPREGPLKLAFEPENPTSNYGLVDLSQAELRSAALLSDDEKLAEALTSQDAHRWIASRIHGKPEDQVTETERKASKKITFGLLYGGSINGLAERSGLKPAAVRRIVTEFFNQFPKLAAWIEAQKRYAGRHQIITTPFGRTRDLRELYAIGDAPAAERRAINTPIQSLASDVMLTILVETADYLRQHNARSRFLFSVHDSAIFEVAAREETLLAEAIETGFLSLAQSPLSAFRLWPVLPLTGDLAIGANWAAVEETNAGYNPIMGVSFSSLEGILD